MWPQRKTTLSSLNKYWLFCLPIGSILWPCLNILVRRGKQQHSHLSFNSRSWSCRWIIWNAQFPIFKTTPHLCCNRQFAIIKQSSIVVYNLHKLLQLKCIIFQYKLQYRMPVWYIFSYELQPILSHHQHLGTTIEVLHCKCGQLVSGWLAADGCNTYALPYGVWAETQQWGELGHGGGSKRTTLNSAGRLGNSCLEQFVSQVRLLRLERRTAGPLYLLILTWDLVSAMEPVDSVPASKDKQIVGARTSWEAGGWGCGIAVSGVLDCVLTSRQGIVLQLPRAAGS